MIMTIKLLIKKYDYEYSNCNDKKIEILSRRKFEEKKKPLAKGWEE